MAYLVVRGDIYHLCHNATPDGKRARFSTGYRTDIGKQVRLAKEMEAEYTLKERQANVGRPRFREEEKWDNWLPGFIAMHYHGNAGTLRRYKSVERTLRMFWTEHGIETPRQLTRQHCFAYFEWRKKPDASKGKFAATHNTALLEIQTLGMIMKEAVIRGYAQANPCRELGFGREEEQKPMDLNDALLAELEANIATAPDADRLILERSYLVARYHGVRLTETHVNPMRDVALNADRTSGEITFYQKGGRKRTKPLHPKLIPLFAELIDAGASESFPMPANLAALWHRYFVRWKMKRHGKVCFHSLRVTVQNKLRRAGIPEDVRKAYLSHEAGGDVHAGYSRVMMDEMRACHGVL